MNRVISGHRASYGIMSVLLLTLLSFTLALGDSASRMVLFNTMQAALTLLGAYGIIGSPYWSIVYREAPLKRAITGVSDLDERELALRDRANGLTYNLFVAANVAGLAIAASALRWQWFQIDASALYAVLLPYCWFAFSLPVIMLEWFEPSDLWAQPANEEEE